MGGGGGGGGVPVCILSCVFPSCDHLPSRDTGAEDMEGGRERDGSR